MTHPIYGERTIYVLAAKDSPEIRYVGSTARSLRQRLTEHRHRAKSPRQAPFDVWIGENAGNIAIYEVGVEPDAIEARVTERRIAEECLADGCRLFNRHFVHRSRRLVGDHENDGRSDPVRRKR